MKSIQKVREHEMFKKIFEEFADVLGINTETEKPNEWIELEKVLEAHRKKKEEEALQSARNSLQARLDLWNAICKQIEELKQMG